MFIHKVFVQSVGIYVSSFSMFDRRLFLRYIVGGKIRNKIIRKEKIDMELDSFPFCLFSFPLSREKKKLTVYRRDFDWYLCSRNRRKCRIKADFRFFQVPLQTDVYRNRLSTEGMLSYEMCGSSNWL